LQRTHVNGFGTGIKQIFFMPKFYPFVIEAASNVKKWPFLRGRFPV